MEDGSIGGMLAGENVGRRSDDVEGGGIGRRHKNLPQWIVENVVHCGIFVFHDFAVGDSMILCVIYGVADISCFSDLPELFTRNQVPDAS